MQPKVVRWYKKMKFWNFVGYIVTPLTVSGEGAILALHLNPWYHAAVVGAVVVSGWVKYMIKDENGDGIVDE